MPREEFVAAFTRACGCPPDQVAQWVEARRRLAVEAVGGAEPAPAPVATDDGGTVQSPVAAEPAGAPPPSPRGRSVLRSPVRPAVVCIAAIALVLATVALSSESAVPLDRPTETPRNPRPSAASGADAAPAPGRYRIRLVHSGLCLSEREGDTSGQVRQLGCSKAFPVRALLAGPGGTYRITTDHPAFGPGCMGVRKARTAPGASVFDDYCGERGANAGGEDYRLERVSAPTRGFRLRPVHSGLCLGVPDGSTGEGSAIQQLPCEPTGGGQVFRFDPDKPAPG
ncbi:hypothetical protein DMH08_02640 [Actinomadura sp. WAC 06369]|nr:hypothetical protein DMH08_02640 [Actinomadura sp. WAC 06369]